MRGTMCIHVVTGATSERASPPEHGFHHPHVMLLDSVQVVTNVCVTQVSGGWALRHDAGGVPRQ